MKYSPLNIRALTKIKPTKTNLLISKSNKSLATTHTTSITAEPIKTINCSFLLFKNALIDLQTEKNACLAIVNTFLNSLNQANDKTQPTERTKDTPVENASLYN